MARTCQEWYDWCMKRGTSGDQVFDILQDWRSEKNLASTDNSLQDQDCPNWQCAECGHDNYWRASKCYFCDAAAPAWEYSSK